MREIITKREIGFTLIELLIAMALALVIISALSTAFISQRKTYAVQENVSEMIQTARAAMDMITREIKMAGLAPTGHDKKFEDGTATVQTSPLMQRKDPNAARFVGISYNSDSSVIDIYADIQGDGAISTSTGSTDHITYSKAAGEYVIKRNTNTGGSPQPFVENIHSFSVAYLDEDGVNTTAVADIRQVEITITARTAQPDPDYMHPINNDHYRTYTLTSRTTPPNLVF